MFAQLKEVLAHRMSVVFVLGVLMLAAAFAAADALGLPAFFQVALYKGFLLFAAAHAGYWIDRLLFPYARPDKCLLENALARGYRAYDKNGAYDEAKTQAEVNTAEPILFALLMLRRAVIVLGAMLCVAFGA